MKKTLLVATALTTSAYTFSSVAAQPSSSVLQSLPAEVQKDIEEQRTSCSSLSLSNGTPVTSDDGGLIQFLLGGRKAVLVDPILICGGCYHGVSCSKRGTR